MNGVSGLRAAAGAWKLVEKIVNVNIAPAQLILGIDADRWMFGACVANGVIGNVSISTLPTVTGAVPGSTGIQLTQQIQFFKYSDWGGFIQGNWYAVASSGTVQINLFTADIVPIVQGE